MPKGVMWRAEDIFFAAMGGGNYGGPGIEKPEDIQTDVSANPGVSFALAPLMHGNAQWSTFVALFGGNTVTLNASRQFDADEIWDLVERENVNVISLVGDAMARPLVDTLARPHRAAVAVRARVGRRDPLPGNQAGAQRACAERRDHRRIRGVGDRAPTARSKSTGKGPRFQMNEWTTVITEAGDIAPVGEVGLLARARPRTGRLLQGRGEDRGDVHRTARRALGDPRRPGRHRGRRQDQRARPRLAVHQHRRREGLPRRGRSRAEEPPRRLRRGGRRRSRRTLGRDGRGGGRTAYRPSGHARRHGREHCRTAARGLQGAA